MNLKTKKSNLTKSLYIILILCIISVVCLSVYAFFAQKNSSDSKLLDNGNSDRNSVLDSNSGGNSNNENEQLLRIFGTTESRRQDVSDEIPTEQPSQPLATDGTQDDDIPQSNDDTDSGKETAGESSSLPTVKDAELNEAYPDAETPQVIENSNADNIADAVEVLAVPSFFLKPVNGSLSKSYNPDNPEYSVMMNDYRTHTGIDIESDIGANVKAAADGIVSEIYDDPMMGKTIVISHAGGIESVYMNLQQLIPQNITVGASVKAGDVIGGVGETSLIELSDVPHLHFAMKKDGELVDPLDYVQY